MSRSLNYRNFGIALMIAFFIAIALLVISFALGKEEFFLLLNGDLGIVGDHVFALLTYTGDGLMWIVVLLIVFFILQRKDTAVLLVTSFALSTAFTQVCKYFILTSEPRPTKVITDATLIHIVPGVEIYTVSSFPSGHAATIFCFYFLFCLLLTENWWLIVGLVFALLTAYSRIYLAQHFPLDVAAGIIVAIISVYTSTKLQQYWWQRRMLRKTSK